MATDWLVSAWDQNSGLPRLTPAHSAVEDVTSTWLLDLLRISVSNWSTTERDVERSLEAVRTAVVGL